MTDEAEAHAAWEDGDYKTAFEKFLPLAEESLGGSQYNIGILYDTGRGVAQDRTEALKWFRRSAENGYSLAYTRLGISYHQGIVVPQDYSEAAKWYRKGAEKGNDFSLAALGLMYANGVGVEQDYVKAHMYYNLADTQGDEEWRDTRDEIAEHLTPAAIEEAQKMAREWMEKYPTE